MKQRGLAIALTALAFVVAASILPWRDLAMSARNQLAWQIQAGTPALPDQMLRMPDGVRLATDIYLPDGGTRHPAVLMRLPYGKRSYGEIRFWVDQLVRRGFAVVAQDMRGRHGSEGFFAPYPNAGPDGAATLDWIIAQPWSNGRVGTLGCSALGESQLMLAARTHPAHRAMVPIAAGGAAGSVGGRFAYFGAFEGGIFNLAASVGWFGSEGGKTPETSDFRPINPGAVLGHIPVEGIVSLLRPDQTDFETFLRRFEDTQHWQEAGFVTGDEKFRTPALFIDTWHDPSITSTFALADAVRSAGVPVATIIAAGTHCAYLGTDGDTTVGDLPVAPQSTIGYVDLISRFLTHHLADGPPPGLPTYTYFTLVENRWRSSDTWPPAEAEPLAFHLSGEGELTRNRTEVEGATRSFRSDPTDPVPSIGGPLCCTGDPEARSGPVLQNAIETRSDLLVYSSEPLKAPLRIAGPLQARIRVSADVPDTDLIVRLTDVDERGNSLLVQEGALRLRYRDGVDDPAPLENGKIYDVTVQIRDVAYLFRSAHRLRIHVAGTSFPRLERNMNTGRDNFSESDAAVAEITVHSDPRHPSTLLLYALPD